MSLSLGRLMPPDPRWVMMILSSATKVATQPHRLWPRTWWWWRGNDRNPKRY